MKHVGITLLFVVASLTAKAQLFTNTSVDRNALAATEYTAMTATINADLLRNKVSEFEIDLPNGMRTTAAFTRLKEYDHSKYSWFGHLKSQPEEQILISRVKDSFAGAIYTQSGTFEIQPLGNGKVRIAELNSDAFPACDGEEVAEKTAHAAHDHAAHDHSTQSSSGTINTVTRGATTDFDVIVLYTSAARDGAGGVSQIEATALAAVDAMNLSMNNSSADGEAHMTYTGLSSYAETGDSSTDLSGIRSDAQAATLRNAFGGDLVALLVNSMSGCGRGYVMRNPGPGFASSAYQITRRNCAVGNLSFAHEFGHNLGLEHNPEDSSATLR